MAIEKLGTHFISGETQYICNVCGVKFFDANNRLIECKVCEQLKEKLRR